MMKKTMTKTLSVLSSILILSGIPSLALADDTDIIDFEYSGGSNILFIMDMSGSMDYELGTETIPTDPKDSRKSILQDALRSVLNNPKLTDINIGISSFAGDTTAGMTADDTWNQSGHGISYPVSPIDNDADGILNGNSLFSHKGTSYLPLATVGSAPAVSISSRGYVGSSVPSTWIPFGGTPIVDALYEAALYFRGEAVRLGDLAPSNVRSAHPSTYKGSAIASGSGGVTYISPITKTCSNNAIVLLSDGQPSLNTTASLVTSLIKKKANNCENDMDSSGNLFAGRCGANLTNFLAKGDNSKLKGKQVVKTHTIGLALSNDVGGVAAKEYLEDIAEKGDGEYVSATSSTGLVAALSSTIKLVSKARSFSSPTYTPDLSSLLSHSNDVYLPVFDRGTGPNWSGNLKKFKIKDGKLYDKNNNEITNSDGSLKDYANDYWATTLSDNAVKSGGVANMLDPATRTLKTDNGGTALISIDDVTAAQLGAADATERSRLISFIKGEKSDGSARHHMGDIIHSKPVHLAYGKTAAEKVIFVGTNEGFLHAINDSDGSEIFAYMPTELLINIKSQYENDADQKHLYGVDGKITLWHDDLDHNRIVNNGEKAILYFGLRRGGKAYYAIDVSNRTSPQLLWKINTSKTGFSDLGYSWSQPVRAMMKFGSNIKAKPVLVFGGGYIDDAKDSTETDGAGRAAEVYIVDAENGNLIWKTSYSKLAITPSTSKVAAVKYAVPARIRVLDIDNNGSLDRLYFGDTGGNVWRVDFQEAYKAITDARVMHFANLGTVSSPATSRRMFFVEPDVALFKHGGQYVYSVAIGSGERPKPLDFTGDDHFFTMFDTEPLKTFEYTDASTDIPDVIVKSNLVNTTVSPTTNALTSPHKGWFIDLVKIKGEKVLSRALTYNNMVMFTTLGATTVTITDCGIQSDNFSRLYAVDLMTGGAVLDLDDSGSTNQSTSNAGTSVGTGISDTSKQMTSGEIIETPIIRRDELKTKVGGVCSKGDCVRKESVCTKTTSECIDLNAANIPPRSVRKVFWLDKE